ncbi:MAG: YlqD family protein [Armatimonadetes bacterium]|nr:YlqD family protein [Armatimonadota bacterium]
MGIIIKRPVRVKIIVTEEFKARRLGEIRASVARLDDVIKRLDFEIDSLSRRSYVTPEEKKRVGERLERTRRKNERLRAALMQELDVVKSLEIGTEHDRGILEGLVEVNVGDDFDRVGSCEIIVKDDKIVEIRNGLCPATGET